MWHRRCLWRLNDMDAIATKAEEFIKKQVTAASSNGVIFGLSGGIDSTVIAYLCSRALGSERCMALLMPNSEFTPVTETDDGKLVAESLSIPHTVIQISTLSREAVAHERYAETDGILGNKMNVGNLNARLRAALLYYEAQKRNYLVVGTDDKSEHMIGYFTKYGDGACDMMPIADLYKTQVWELARHLEVPQHIIDKEPSPHLWKDHSMSKEIGMQYDAVDSILDCISKGADLKDTITISKKLNIPTEKVSRIISLYCSSEHKRLIPPTANLMNACNTSLPKTIKIKRSWGNFEQFTLNIPSTVKIITVDPGASLSLQRHIHRSEFWRVISGEAVAILGNESIHLTKGDSLFVPVETVHRLTGGSKGAQILEIAIGDFSENDIIRFQD